MSKKKYANAAEKQKAWRIRHGQKKKVPLELRRGEELGASETTLREKKEGETWEEYSNYLKASVQAARRRQVSAGGKERAGSKPGGDTRGQRVYSGDYYEMRREMEKPPEGRKIKQKRGKK